MPPPAIRIRRSDVVIALLHERNVKCSRGGRETVSIDRPCLLWEDAMLGDLPRDLVEALEAGRAVHAGVAGEMAVEGDDVLDVRGDAHEVASGEHVLLAVGHHLHPSL